MVAVALVLVGGVGPLMIQVLLVSVADCTSRGEGGEGSGITWRYNLAWKGGDRQ